MRASSQRRSRCGILADFSRYLLSRTSPNKIQCPQDAFYGFLDGCTGENQYTRLGRRLLVMTVISSRHKG
jgi:hypothetical protein